jgi:hypothetical protein
MAEAKRRGYGGDERPLGDLADGQKLSHIPT